MALQKWTLLSLITFMMLSLVVGQCKDWFYIGYVSHTYPYDTCVLDGTDKMIQCKQKTSSNAQKWCQQEKTVVNNQTGKVFDAQKGLKVGAPCITYEKKTKGDVTNQHWNVTRLPPSKIINIDEPNLAFTMDSDKKCTIQKEDISNLAQIFVITSESGILKLPTSGLGG